MSNKELNALVGYYAKHPENAEANYQVGLLYEGMGQTAAAISFFLRAAERTSNNTLAYECMLKVGLCFDRQGRRANTVRGAYQHALLIHPNRPEAYFLLSRFYERSFDHVNGYMYADLGLKNSDFTLKPLRGFVEYPGRYGLIFEKMVCAWWWGKPNECRELLQVLKNEYGTVMDEQHRLATEKNLLRLGSGPEDYAYRYYFAKNYPALRYKFPGSEMIQRNYSQVYQDLFILAMRNGKHGGTYLEIGSERPEIGNNTKLLEDLYGWKGYGIEIDDFQAQQYRKFRKNPLIHADALTVDYHDLLSKLAVNGEVDYLQLDCEPSAITYEIMTKIPFDNYKFAVVTYEHDHYVDMTGIYRQKSRDFLLSKGYVMVVNDVSPDGRCNFEDWWCHPDLINPEIFKKMVSIKDTPNNATEYTMSGTLSSPVTFDWGELAKVQWFLFTVDAEIFGRRLYEKFFPVEKGDVVMDVGASAGPFSYSILEKQPKEVYCIEPHPELFKTLKKNLGSNAYCHNVAITNKNGPFISTCLFDATSTQMQMESSQAVMVEGMKFDTFLGLRGIDHIDFLKCDCEGGEYDIFNDDNRTWILKNVRKVAGEWHLHTPELKQKFRRFRDTYLKAVKNIEVFSIDEVDIKWDLWNDHFIEYYGVITLYMDNR